MSPRSKMGVLYQLRVIMKATLSLCTQMLDWMPHLPHLNEIFSETLSKLKNYGALRIQITGY